MLLKMFRLYECKAIVGVESSLSAHVLDRRKSQFTPCSGGTMGRSEGPSKSHQHCSVEFIGQFVMILVMILPNDAVSVVKLLIYIKPAKLV